MDRFKQDLYFGMRMLFKSPGFTLVAILSLMIGIGINITIFSVINTLLLRPLPYQDPDRLVIMWNRSPGLNITQDWLSVGEYLDLKNDNKVFEQVAVILGDSFNFTGQGLPEYIEGVRVSSSLFPLLGAEAALGRRFMVEDDEKGKPPIVILSYGFWQRRFGGDANVIGKTLSLNGNNFTIVGVMPRSFALTREVLPTINGIQKADVLLPLPLNESDRANRGQEDYNVLARLKPGISLAQAQADVKILTAQMQQQYSANYPATSGFTIVVRPLLEQVVGEIRLALYILIGAVIFVHLISCANIASLLLARAVVRQKEIAMRVALGADRFRIIRQMLTESLLLALIGGLSGLLFAQLMVQTLRIFGPENIPRLAEISIDKGVMIFTVAIMLLTAVLFGLVPALRASRVNLNEVLKDAGSNPQSGRVFRLGHHRIQQLIIVAEIALSFVLLIGATLLIRSYQQIASANPGFNAHNVLSLRMTLPKASYSTPESITTFYQQLDQRIKRLPGVESVSTSYLLPLSSVALGWEPITVDGYLAKPGEELIISSSGYISPDYFRVMGIPLLKGRFFTEQDIKGTQPVAIIDDKFAQRFWPGQDAIGKQIRRGDKEPWRTIIGVVGDEREYSLDIEPPITAYYPVLELPIRSRFLIARTTTDAAHLTNVVAAEIHNLDPELPIYDVKTMEQRLSDSLAIRRFLMFLLSIFAGIALLLAAIGIYGVMTYWVDQRRHEIGIRMAVGAQPRHILQMVIGKALILVIIGIGIGLLGAFALTDVVTSLLYGIESTDKLTFLITPFLLAMIGLLASFLPAWRAIKVDPLIALKY